MNILVQVAVGGVSGALCRLAVSRVIPSVGSGFPLPVFLVNLSGCLLAGFLFVLCQKNPSLDKFTPAIFTGFLGAYTTFSAFGLETWQLVQNKEWTLAVAYVLGTNIAGILLVFTGVHLAKQL